MEDKQLIIALAKLQNRKVFSMNKEELLKTLNPKQVLYTRMDLPDPTNGEYLLAVFHLIPGGELNIMQAAAEIAAESSTGTNFTVKTETPFSRVMNALVYKVDMEKNLIWIAYPWRLFDRNGNVQNIMTYLVGNVLGMKEIKALKLLDIWFPPSMLEQYDGPSYTLDDMRTYLDVHDRPILGTIIKPKMGLTSSEYAEVCYDFWVGGGDFVKNDEPQADQDFCPYHKMVKYVKMAMDKAVKETGRKKVHSFNVSSADFDTMIERCEMIREAGFEPGSYAFLIDGITAGWMAVQTLRRRYPDVFLHFHRAGHGGFTRPENPIGFSVLVLSKLARLAGASGIHTGTAGVGKMAGSPEEDVTAARNILKVEGKGHFFTQNWGRIPPQDDDAIKMVEMDDAHHVVLEDDSWRGLKKVLPNHLWRTQSNASEAFHRCHGRSRFHHNHGRRLSRSPQRNTRRCDGPRAGMRGLQGEDRNRRLREGSQGTRRGDRVLQQEEKAVIFLSMERPQ